MQEQIQKKFGLNLGLKLISHINLFNIPDSVISIIEKLGIFVLDNDLSPHSSHCFLCMSLSIGARQKLKFGPSLIKLHPSYSNEEIDPKI